MSLKLINEELIQEVTQAAQNSSRLRSYYTFHENNSELTHRLLKAIEPASYVRPHRHEKPDKTQAFIILKGKLAVVLLADDGRVQEYVVLQTGGTYGCEIPPTAWHTMIALESGTIVYEVVEGPWDQETHKTYPTWAPAEEDVVSAQAFIAKIRQDLMLY